MKHLKLFTNIKDNQNKNTHILKKSIQFNNKTNNLQKNANNKIFIKQNNNKNILDLSISESSGETIDESTPILDNNSSISQEINILKKNYLFIFKKIYKFIIFISKLIYNFICYTFNLIKNMICYIINLFKHNKKCCKSESSSSSSLSKNTTSKNTTSKNTTSKNTTFTTPCLKYNENHKILNRNTECGHLKCINGFCKYSNNVQNKKYNKNDCSSLNDELNSLNSNILKPSKLHKKNSNNNLIQNLNLYKKKLNKNSKKNNLNSENNFNSESNLNNNPKGNTEVLNEIYNILNI